MTSCGKTNTLHDEVIHITPSVPCTSMAIGIKWCPSLSPLYLQILAMALSSVIALVGQLMTFEATVSRIRSLTTTSAMTTLSFQVMKRWVHNETLDIRAYCCFLQTTCSIFRARAYMTSCVAIY
jgi:hypothetical protein